MSRRNKNRNSNRTNQRRRQPNNVDYPAQTGIIGAGGEIVGFFISITEYIVLFIIHELSDILGIQTEGKDLNYILEQFNKALEDPVTREQLRVILSSLGEILIIFLDEFKEPIKGLLNDMIDIGADASHKIVKRLVDLLLDAIGIIPGVGEILEAIRAVDDVVIQIQAVIGVLIKSSTMFINFFGDSLNSINNVKTRIEDVTDKINSQIGNINSLVNIPSLDGIKQHIQQKVITAMPALNIDPVKIANEKLQQGIKTSIDKHALALAAPRQTGGVKAAKKNIKLTTERIKRTIKAFCIRNNKTKKCRRN
jgi:hypothetical protein